ncbi:hypothetical protein J1N35_021415 [Gossypium stocksii]|uniref:RRP15-like protein n=1 Tax=Gossypium stocksii TaxID=47602 RepID=A0A9D4A2E3_9ROSI|nr:hypothetical protein J1N35_021415 [Gossypium stocksii]
MTMEEGSFTAGKRKRNLGKKKGNKAKNKKLKKLEGKGKKFKVKKGEIYLRNVPVTTILMTRRRRKRKTQRRRQFLMIPGEGAAEIFLLKEVMIQKEKNKGGGEIQPGIMRFTEGVRAFRLAFKNIIKRNVADDSLVAQKGHVNPANYLDSQEKFLIGIATKGGIVNKAQKAQKGLDPSRSKDAKVIRKRRKEAFFSELGKTSLPARDSSSKGNTSSDSRNDEGPAWAPLRDNYMLTNPKLKEWDKMADSAIVDGVGRISEDSG